MAIGCVSYPARQLQATRVGGLLSGFPFSWASLVWIAFIWDTRFWASSNCSPLGDTASGGSWTSCCSVQIDCETQKVGFLIRGSGIEMKGLRPRTTEACDAAMGALAWTYLLFAYVTVEFELRDIPICPMRLLLDRSCLLCGSTHFIGSCLHERFDPTATNLLPAVIWFAIIVFLALRYGVAFARFCFSGTRRWISVRAS
jgi:hypothetical protein